MGPPRSGQQVRMIAVAAQELELADAWIEGDAGARWRSVRGHAPSSGGSRASGSSILEVQAGHRLPRHTDSAEETIVVLDGAAEVVIGDESERLAAPALAVMPADVPHEVRNAGDTVLRFAAVYAAPDVVTRYERPVQPDGSPERHTVD